MQVLKGLEPSKVFTHFESITQIPHGSGNTDKLGDWLVDFARSRGLESYKDEIGNVTMIKAASPGYENADPVILQAHMDMVCEKIPGCPKDMATEGLDLVVDGDLIYAKDTSLGGDDGIGVAMILAFMDDDSLKHPKIEALITVEEETGLYGAEAYDITKLKGNRFINLDSEDEGILSISCAGGVDLIANIPFKKESAPGLLVEIGINDLTGGHSGMEINKGLGNANKLLGTLLNRLLDDPETRLVTLEGGYADNVITVSAKALITTENLDSVKDICTEYEAFFKHKYKADPRLHITVTTLEGNRSVMDRAGAAKVVAFLEGTPNGVQAMTPGLDKLPQTSLSLGIVRTLEDNVEYTFCLRSSVDKEKELLVRQLEKTVEAFGGTSKRDADYPGWEYEEESPIRDLVCEVYKEVTGKEMILEAIHAGLECGYFVSKKPGLDCVSIGPDVTDVHSPKERLHIQSIQRVWNVLVKVLERLN